MIGDLIYKAKGKVVKDVLAWDTIGYDVGFTLEFEDFSIEVYPTINSAEEARLIIEKGEPIDEEE